MSFPATRQTYDKNPRLKNFVTNIFVKWLTLNNGFDQDHEDIFVKS